MAVIGRLDDQVDSLLIAPLDRNRRDTTEAQQQSKNPQQTQSQTDIPAPGEAESFQHEQAVREELPVWLL
jgi:hypothetical protein